MNEVYVTYELERLNRLYVIKNVPALITEDGTQLFEREVMDNVMSIIWTGIPSRITETYYFNYEKHS
jgi:hypothetical protein